MLRIVLVGAAIFGNVGLVAAQTKKYQYDVKPVTPKGAPVTTQSLTEGMTATLRELGKQGWEYCGESAHSVFVRKAGTGEWEYKLVKTPAGKFNARADDDEAVILLIDGLQAQGWELAAIDTRALPGVMLFKRQKTEGRPRPKD